MTGFHNVRPEGREKRKLVGNKHLLEKTRLANRKEGFQRHVASTDPLSRSKQSASYIDNETRFLTDAAAQEKSERDYALERKKKQIEKLGQERIQREENRQRKLLQDHEKENQRIKYLQTQSKKAAKNDGSTGYNLVSLEVRQGNEKLAKSYEYQKEMIQYEGAKKSQEKYQRLHSTQYNPVTGQPLPQRIKVPQKPERPQDFVRTRIN
mmetsp:Transcript_5353/g.7892  ORF Transcript_5353/g.7892 Transcript_5353/m.7892 type:complete len:209 (-) Transcript_5353:1251-1877(-)